MKSNTDYIKELLTEYKQQKAHYEQKLKTFEEVYLKWDKGIEEVSVKTDKTIALDSELDRAMSELNKSKEEYNNYAHIVLGFIIKSN